MSFRIAGEDSFNVPEVVFSTDGTVLATISDILQVWDVASETELPRPDTTYVLCLAAGQDRIATTENAGNVWLYTVP